tara:strand:- start:30 stop:323 length:294 start_codon:yes stop_codon:yes gene_type:complete
MAITKEAVIEKIEVIGSWNVQVATDTVIKEDGTEIGRSRHRHVLVPFVSLYNDDTKKWSHTATDISGENTSVQAIANAAWSDDVKTAYKTWKESQEV